MLSARDAAKLFSSKRIAEIAQGNYSYLLKIAEYYQNELECDFTVLDVINCSYDGLSKEYRGEYFFKNVVVEKILLGRHSLNTATVLPEFRVGKSKADCVILNGSSTCYEIKSDFDNLDRLPEQLAFYKKIFDRIYVVVGQAHLKKAIDSCSEDIGVIELTDKKSLRVVREAELISQPIDVSILMRSLRVSEYRAIVKNTVGRDLEYSNTEIFSACESILQTVPSTVIRKEFCSVLKKSRKIEKDFVLALPRALLMAGIGYKLSKSQRRGLLNSLGVKFSKDALCTTKY